jgi:quercetin dioxygenase-like cupin family protein
VEWSDPPGRAYEPHTHEHDEVIALLRGAITFDIGGVDYPLAPGDILFLPAGTLHAAQAHPAEGAAYLMGSRAAAKGRT